MVVRDAVPLLMPSSPVDIKFWIGFNVVVLALIGIDLGVFQRRGHVMKMKEAALWSAFWIALALGFNGFVWYEFGDVKAQEFLLGYVMEKSLSVDNLFVFVIIFNYFAVKPEYQRRVLSFGIIGALVMRAGFIAMGAILLQKFHWMDMVFGGFLVYTGVKMMRHDDEELHPENNPVVAVFRKLFPVAGRYHEHRFFIREAGKLMATPLFLVLLVVESSDVVFAVDSIPAIFGVTSDPFIVYTSNVCAILGLRALYFLLAGMITQFRFLKLGISVVLMFIGAKMLLGDESFPVHVKIEPTTSLVVVGTILVFAVLSSWMIPLEEDRPNAGPTPPTRHGGDVDD